MITPGTLPTPIRWAFPVSGRHVLTSSYGVRVSPRTGKRTMHHGLDISVPVGTPVAAVADGVVREARTDSAGGCRGQYVIIDHGGGWDSRSFHLSRIAVTPGQHVTAGAIIGAAGATGCVTGPHLHIELWRDGASVDPLPLLTPLAPAVGVLEDGEELDVEAADLAGPSPRRAGIPVRLRLSGDARAAAADVGDGLRAAAAGATLLGAGAILAAGAALAISLGGR